VRETLSRSEARRVALRAQGFGRAALLPGSSRRLSREIDRMATLQIDSVNVFARSHYMPLFSRVGPYDTARLDRLLFARRAPYVEYWAHQAAFIAAEDRPLFGFRMQAHRERHERTGWFAVDDRTLDWVRGELRARGPLRPAQIEDDAARASRGPWWDWSSVKSALEYLWFIGEVAIAGRRGFERVYGLAEDVLPAEVVGRTVPKDDAVRELVARAARAYGVATLTDLDDYWRLRDQRAVSAAVQELVDAGELSPVQVEGWRRGERPLRAWLHRDAVVPRTVDAATVLTPFDPMVWFRDRAERVFDFSYRIEIYTPAAQRRYGYYSLPLLLGDGIAGRIDLKADRAAGTLRVQSAWWEPSRPAEAAASVAEILRSAASWQGLETITVSRWGDATDEIAGALGSDRHDAGPEPVALAEDEPG
jgi:uncharacterized protein YcaQ